MKLKELCFEITNKCPMSCVHCSAEAGTRLGNELSITEIKRVIREFSDLGGEILEISGGEPTSHKGIFEIIEYSKEFSLEVRLYTSGFLINKSVINQLKASNVDKVIFNLQGATPNVHEKITRTQGSFDRVIRNIKECVSNGFWVGVHFVPMKPNFNKLLKTFELCSTLNVNEFAILRFVPQGRGRINKERLELSGVELKNLFITMDEIVTGKVNARIGRPFNIRSSCYYNQEFERCNAGNEKCLIKPNGDVAPCPAFKQNQEYVAGNIRKDTLSDIWADSLIWNEFREFNYSRLTGSCATCKKLSRCQGGCAAQRILTWHSINAGPDPSCITCESDVENLVEVILEVGVEKV